MTTRLAIRISAAYGGGWCATVTRQGEEPVRVFYGPRGGAWDLSDDGTVGGQIAGRLDCRCPADRARARAWIRRTFDK